MRRTVFAAALMGVAALALSCQTYDFEPVEPLAISQNTEKKIVFSRALKPNLMLLVDKSGSMNTPTTNGTRLTNMKSAMGKFLTQFGATARMGLAVFPNSELDASCGVACNPGRVLKTIVQSNDVESELRAAATSINDVIQAIGSGGEVAKGGTPTAPSLAVLGEVAELTGDEREDFVLLLTDGLPNCNNNANINTCTCTAAVAQGAPCNAVCNCLEAEATVTAITALRNKDIRTIVVGFGTETGASVAGPTLNSMAEAGGFARKCESDAQCGGETCDLTRKLCATRFYRATDEAELAAALAEIGGSLVPGDPCEFKLNLAPTEENMLAVYIDGERTPAGANTWTYESSGPAVQFQGDLCTRIRDATRATPVDVEFRVVQAL